jgi:hypothetical protein
VRGPSGGQSGTDGDARGSASRPPGSCGLARRGFAVFERIVVQISWRGQAISEYVAGILERQVPDHRTIQAVESDEA